MELITAKEAAKLLKMSTVTLAIWRRECPKRLPAIMLPNGRIRYDMADIREFLATCRQDSAGSNDSAATESRDFADLEGRFVES